MRLQGTVEKEWTKVTVRIGESHTLQIQSDSH